MAGRRPFNDNELPRMLAAMIGRYRLRDRLMLIMGVRTGFRISELLSLTIGDVVAGGELVDVVTVGRRHMKGGKKKVAAKGEKLKQSKTSSRSVPLHADVKAALRPWLAALRRLGYMQVTDCLFQSRAGHNKAITVQRAIQIYLAAAARAGIYGAIGTHSARKTFAARMHRAFGGDLRKIQVAMGHIRIDSTAQYITFTASEIAEAILA